MGVTLDYRGRTVLVTGASKGLGRALAADAARRGAVVVLVARSTGALKQLATELTTAHHVPVHAITADLGTTRGVADVEAFLDAEGLQVDVLINNAGLGFTGPFVDRPLDQALVPIRVNIGGVVELTHALGRRMSERGSGGIINVGSTAAFQPMPYQTVYAATKAFVLSFTEALAEELAPRGVTAMIASPGPTATEFFAEAEHAPDMQKADPAETVARDILDDFARGRAASYPGRRANRAQTWASRFFPRTRIARLTAGMNRKNGFDR